MKHHQQVANRLLLAMLAMASFGAAQAASSTSEGSRLYAPCGACHAPKAWGSMDGTIPNLAGQQRRYLEKQLELFRSGARVDLAMQIVAFDRRRSTRHRRPGGLSFQPGFESKAGERLGRASAGGTGDIRTHLCRVSWRRRPGRSGYPGAAHCRTALSLFETTNRRGRGFTQGSRAA